MTKARAPLSIEQAIQRVVGELGDDGVEAATGHKPPVIRNMSDPDHPREISLKDAIALDVAFRNAGGVGLPFHQCFSHQLKIEAAATAADARALARQAAIAAKESGDANAALMLAMAPGATEADRAIARREVAESIAAGQDTLALLQEPKPRESG
ncbi:hypothetical protein O4H52_08020 [Sphingomonadaceae bacterium G21617-S1]|nr:hypothetical protein [Sphingomonadaceae bacterium G21617-S1]